MVDPLDVIALGQARILVADLTKKCERLQDERDELLARCDERDAVELELHGEYIATEEVRALLGVTG